MRRREGRKRNHPDHQELTEVGTTNGMHKSECCGVRHPHLQDSTLVFNLEKYHYSSFILETWFWSVPSMMWAELGHLKKVSLGCGEKATLLHCWWECKLVQSLWRTVWIFLKEWEIELPNDPAIPLLGIYLKKTETLIWKDTCIPMFTAALLTIAKIWK